MKKILITGAAGFIGSHLCEKLLSDYKVVGIDNLSLGRKENIQHLRSNRNFTFHQCEILDPKEFENIFRIHSFDIIFHLAANSDISNGNPKIDFQNTLSTTLVVLEKCRIRDIKEFIFASSSAIYGETKELITENFGPLNPISHYGAAKLSSEAFISAYSKMYDIKSWICRFPNVCGDHVTHGVILDFINKIKNNPDTLEVLGDGNQIKPYIYIKELIEAIIFIWQNTNEKFNVYNIGVDSQTKVSEIAEMVVKEVGKGTKIKYTGGDRGWKGDVPQFRFSTDKIRSLGWSAKLTSNEAVQKAIKKILL